MRVLASVMAEDGPLPGAGFCLHAFAWCGPALRSWTLTPAIGRGACSQVPIAVAITATNAAGIAA